MSYLYKTGERKKREKSWKMAEIWMIVQEVSLMMNVFIRNIERWLKARKMCVAGSENRDEHNNINLCG